MGPPKPGPSLSNSLTAQICKSETPVLSHPRFSARVSACHLHRYFHHIINHNSINFAPNHYILLPFESQLIAMPYTEQDMQDALAKYDKCGQGLRKIVREFGILRGTMQGRIRGRKTYRDAAVGMQRLSTVQEDRLTQWVLIQEALGLLPTYQQIIEFASCDEPLLDLVLLGFSLIEGVLQRY
jgi:hypothetical protein